MKPIKAIYNFIVGDMILLAGILITIVLLIIMNTIPILSTVRSASGVVLIIMVLFTLIASLAREAYSRQR